jgi:LPXTG-site transpeptidase (sortase) family protein
MLPERIRNRGLSHQLLYRFVLASAIAVSVAFPAVSAIASPSQGASLSESAQQDDESPPIVPRDEETNAEEDATATETATTEQVDTIDVEIDLDNNTPNDLNDDVVEIDLDLPEPVEPATFTGVIPASVDLQPNQWMGAMDGRLVEPFATPLRPARVRSDVIGLDADITVREIINGEMQTPADEHEVTWYKETGSPGLRGTNVVLAGHLNWYTTPYAVFHNIDELQEGDLIVVTGEDGFEYTYQVRWVKLFDEANADMDALVGPTEKSSLTLITCGGEWGADAGQYGKRTVVRAQIVS